MSNAVSALNEASATGFVDVAEAGLVGMVTIRGDLSDDAFRGAIKSALDLDVPELRQMTASASVRLLWMSPDELLLICPHSEAKERIDNLSSALSGLHHLLANVSDARAVFDVLGNASAIRETLAKLTPADMRAGSLPVGEVRRTRLAQVPAAIWFEAEDRATVVCFRSVAEYVFGILANAARPGSDVGIF